jgi:dihydroorotate dehydrogenase
VADLALELGLDGIIATNTTISREGLRSAPDTVAGIGDGGLSGAPLEARALEVLTRLRARVGSRLVLIAVGGIGSVESAWARIRAGATLVQFYTALVYEGPGFPARIWAGLRRCAREEGLARVQDGVGTAVK